MPKITKVQAECLIAKLQIFSCPENISTPVACQNITFGALFSAIDECTEKPFPEFAITLYGPGAIEKFQTPDEIKVAQHGDATAPLTLTYLDVCNEEWEALIPVAKFKEFTAKCNTIVEWLEEQE